MSDVKSFKGSSLDEAWQQLQTEVTWAESPGNYRAVIHTGKHDINLEIVSSPGGNDEGWGFEQTTLSASLPANNIFHFAIVPEDFLNRIGKFFGMQDVKIGYPEFDENVLVQTNDEGKLKSLFSDGELRGIFLNLSGYSFQAKKDDDSGGQLELLIQRAITHPADLRRLVDVFNRVLVSFEG